MQERSHNKLEFIQALRGFAAISVVICHLRDLFRGTPFESSAMHWMLPGAYGVDLFFIISGFIITLTSYNYKKQDGKKFILKRIIRIWPPYAFWTLAYVVLINWSNLGEINVANIIKSLAFIPLNFDSAIYFGAAALPQGWTLNYEAYFYLVFAICFFFGRFKHLAVFLWFALTLIALPRVLNLTDPKPVVVGFGYINLMMQRMMFEFVFGVICALIYKKRVLQVRSRTMFNLLIFFSFITPFTAYVLNINTIDHGPTNFGMFYMVSFLLLIFCADYIQENIKLPKGLIKAGNMSFSIYLCHIFVMTIAMLLINVAGYEGLEKALSIIALFIPLLMITSFLSYTFLEKKLHDVLHNKLIDDVKPYPSAEMAVQSGVGN
ncbi:hypothetical protein C3369_05810 [Escherichia sp. ESNIH1]|uniref:acyltransferase family protein n=1 Tax=Escherichia sp. ESNIH1 TaxID=1985876 RepID=UPI000CDD6B77|nr:acyltransferase [Escherichia sp. ESNIH1]POU03345.1 hypothetical protein C3369_05810 [Escherichia sp. ESNIH1]